jgi:insertion element IS1 protein InsB
VNKEYLSELPDTATVQADIVQYAENSAELDEQWSFVCKKSNQRWLWLAIEHESRVVLAFAFGRRGDEVFSELKSLLAPYGITTFYTDAWGAYSRNLPAANHVASKSNTQRIERKNLTLRTRVKRLARRTICFSKSEIMHDIVIGLFINFFEFSYFHILIDKLF